MCCPSGYPSGRPAFEMLRVALAALALNCCCFRDAPRQPPAAARRARVRWWPPAAQMRQSLAVSVPARSSTRYASRGALPAAEIAAFCAAAPGAVSVYLTTANQTHLYEQIPSLTLGAASATPTIKVEPTTTYQRIVGFGAAITDASAGCSRPPSRTTSSWSCYSLRIPRVGSASGSCASPRVSRISRSPTPWGISPTRTRPTTGRSSISARAMMTPTFFQCCAGRGSSIATRTLRSSRHRGLHHCG